MAVSTVVYKAGVYRVITNDIIWKNAGGSTMQIGLELDSDTPLKDTWDFADDVNGGLGAGNHTGTNIDLADASTAGTNEVRMGVDDTNYTFTGMSGSQVYGGCYIFKDVGTAATDNLLTTLAFSGGTVTTSDDTDVIVTPHANGLWKITV